MDRIDVSALLLGIDAGSRAAVQRAMHDIAERGDSSAPDGLVHMLREAIEVLRGATDAWTHAGAINHAPMAPEEAEGRFVSLAHEARSRFEDEVIRNAHGKITRTTPEPLPPSDVPGVVVVTLVVAAYGELNDVADIQDRAQLGLALDALAAVETEDFVAMEVIWSPADENDRATAAEIEAKYPELARLGAPSS